MKHWANIRNRTFIPILVLLATIRPSEKSDAALAPTFHCPDILIHLLLLLGPPSINVAQKNKNPEELTLRLSPSSLGRAAAAGPPRSAAPQYLIPPAPRRSGVNLPI